MERLTGVFSPRKKVTLNQPIDPSIDFSKEKSIAELDRGDIFGEMTCISLYPRSATVRTTRASPDIISIQ